MVYNVGRFIRWCLEMLVMVVLIVFLVWLATPAVVWVADNGVKVLNNLTGFGPQNTPETKPVIADAPEVVVDVDEPVDVIPPVPEDGWLWLHDQTFVAPLCDPHTYVWFEPLDDDEGFKPTGAHVDSYDIVLHVNAEGMAERTIAYGTGVSVDGVDYGRSVVYFEAPDRYAVTIDDGAYRAGYDTMGLFPEYYAEVLRCLYGGDWPVKQHSKTLAAATLPVLP